MLRAHRYEIIIFLYYIGSKIFKKYYFFMNLYLFYNYNFILISLLCLISLKFVCFTLKLNNYKYPTKSERTLKKHCLFLPSKKIYLFDKINKTYIFTCVR